MSTPKYPNVRVQLTGYNGNAFHIMGRVGSELRRNCVPREEIEAFYTEARSGDYDKVLQTAMAWVDVQ